MSDATTPKELAPIRIDKWLWAARFFKTRSLARQAIDGGMVHIQGVRAKPSRTLKVGDKLCVRKRDFVYEITVQALTPRRGSAQSAAVMYNESPESLAKREQVAAQMKAMGQSLGASSSHGRPSKRDRRDIEGFTGRRRQ